jgi:hypothetical protein
VREYRGAVDVEFTPSGPCEIAMPADQVDVYSDRYPLMD